MMIEQSGGVYGTHRSPLDHPNVVSVVASKVYASVMDMNYLI